MTFRRDIIFITSLLAWALVWSPFLFSLSCVISVETQSERNSLKFHLQCVCERACAGKNENEYSDEKQEQPHKQDGRVVDDILTLKTHILIRSFRSTYRHIE